MVDWIEPSRILYEYETDVLTKPSGLLHRLPTTAPHPPQNPGSQDAIRSALD